MWKLEKLTQDAIGLAAGMPTSCGFADGEFGTACNRLKSGLTSDNSQYVNQVKPGTVGDTGPRENAPWPAKLKDMGGI